MNSRFSILDSSKFRTYNVELPIIVEGSNLLQDSLSGRLFAQLKLLSISARQISSVDVIIESLDAQNRPVEICNYTYANLHLFRDNTVGEDVLIPLEDNRGRKLNILVKSTLEIMAIAVPNKAIALIE